MSRVSRMTNHPVYFDLDGVIFDFDLHYDTLIGDRKPNGDVHWDRVQQIPDFFEAMPRMRGALELWATVPAHRRRILSSIPKSIKVSGDQKRVAAKKHLGIEGDAVILVRSKKLKQQYAKPGHILIDDWPATINDWRAAGGIGILYVSHEQALVELKSELALQEYDEERKLSPMAIAVNWACGAIGMAVLLVGLWWVWRVI